VNPETITLITRPYQDVVDDILTAIVGGVTNEPIIYDVKSDLYPLAKPATDIRGITGEVNGAHFTFRKEADFLFSEGDNAVSWVEAGARPDDESTFFVDYFLQNSRSPLTDLNVGSVTRTLSEAISREIAIVYEQVNEAYRSGFIDSATGKSLDYVVSILGVTRKTKEFARGLVTFFRASGSTGNITIPEGSVLLADKGEVRFETSELRTLQRGQARIDVPVLAAEGFKGAKGKVDAGKIDTMLAPIEGLDRVVNFEATVLGAEDETDAELRARAKAVLRALGKATLMALFRVILEGRGTPVEAWDPNSPGAKRSEPGTVTVLVEAEPERMPQLGAVVNETRAAGVLTTLVARYVFFKPRLLLSLSPGLPPLGKGKVIRDVIQAIQTYVDGLSSGNDALGAEVLKAAKGVADVKDVKIADVLTFRSDLGSPGAQALVDSLLEALAALPAGADDTAQRQALSAVVAEETPTLTPTGRRIPDRSLLQALDGSPASDEQVEKGEFKVIATVDGEQWWVVLDMEEADIVLV
jgi:hypothetical protein